MILDKMTKLLLFRCKSIYLWEWYDIFYSAIRQKDQICNVKSKMELKLAYYDEWHIISHAVILKGIQNAEFHCLVLRTPFYCQKDTAMFH